MGDTEKIKIEIGDFKFECRGELEKIIDAGIEVLKQHKKVADITSY